MLSAGLAVAYGLLFVGYYARSQEVKLILEDYQYIRTQYLWKQGFGQEGEYIFFSVDAGKNWYAIDPILFPSEKEVKIIGDPNVLYPKTMAFERLLKYVDENGPIDFSKPEHETLMNEAGFTLDKQE